jgi:hypothetical protein
VRTLQTQRIRSDTVGLDGGRRPLGSSHPVDRKISCLMVIPSLNATDIPKHTDLRGHTAQRLIDVAEEINTRRRKTLDWATPADLFRWHETPAQHAAG